MADETREVDVRINLVPGQDQVTPALTRLGQAAQARGAAAPPVIPPDQVQRVGLTYQERAREQLDREREAAELRRVVALERVRQAGGVIPPEQVKVIGTTLAERIRQGLGLGLGGVGAVASGGVGGLLGALGGLPGPLGIAAVAAGALGLAVGRLAERFNAFIPPLSEILERLSDAQARLERGRRTGMAEAADVLRGFGPLARRAIAEGQSNGDLALQLQVAGEQERFSRQRVRQLEELNPEGRQAEALQGLQGARGLAREGGVVGAGGRIWEIGSIAEEIAGAIREQGGVIPAELGGELSGMSGGVATALRGQALRNFLRTATDEQIQGLASTITEPLVQARAALETAENIRRTGFVPSLRAGAPPPTAAPGFQSQQLDVFAFRQMIQQQAVRDELEEIRFNRTFALWQEYRDELRRITGGLGPQPVVS